MDTKSPVYMRESVTISDNSALHGGGILLAAASYLTFSGRVSLTDNGATDAGGAILIANAPPARDRESAIGSSSKSEGDRDDSAIAVDSPERSGLIEGVSGNVVRIKWESSSPKH